MGTVTARIDDETSTRLDRLAKATSRSKSWLVADALQQYLDEQAWQIEQTLEGIRQADAGEFASDEEMKAEFAKWGLEIDSI